MTSTPQRQHMSEAQRIEALEELQALDTEPEQVFNDLVNTAAIVCGTPMSLISLVDVDRQWFKAKVGVGDVTQTSRQVAICAHTIRCEELLEIEDTAQDKRFASNPAVTGRLDIRFYAGAVIRTQAGAAVGTLCVMDHTPRRLNSKQRNVLCHLARAASQVLEFRRLALQVANSEARFQALSEAFPLGVFETAADGHPIYVNERWQAIMGVQRDVALNGDWSQALHPDDKARVGAEWMACAAEKRVYDGTYRVVHTDGRVAYVRALSRPVVGSDGTVTSHVGSVEDITERTLHEEALRHREWLLKETGAIAEVGGWDLDLRTNIVTWSDQTCRIHGLEPGYQPRLDEAINFYAPEAQPVIQAAVERSMATGEDWDLELPLITANNEAIWVRALGHVEFADGEAVRMLGAFQNVTERVVQRQALEAAHERTRQDVENQRQLSDQLDDQRELLEVTLQSMADAVITTDAQGVVTLMNPAAERLTGYTSAEAVNQSLTDVFRIAEHDGEQQIHDPIAACLNDGEIAEVSDSTVLISRTGEEFGIVHSAAPIRKGGDEVLGVVLIVRDVTEQRQLAAAMNHRASHDALTGLFNRREVESRLEVLLETSGSDADAGMLMYIDLDQFKIVNDTCGHSVGDQLLKQVAKLLQESIRSEDTLARFGGDEFAVLLTQCSQEQAMQIGQKICQRMDNFRFEHGSRRFRIGASIGVVPVDERWANSAAVLQAADVACYGAKEAGRNRVVAWVDTGKSLQIRNEQSQWASRIEEALDESAFELFAHRIHEISGNARAEHAEVLIRLRDGDGNLIPPGAFLPAAERFHLATRIDRWVLRETIDQLLTLPDLSPLSMLCVNVSGQSVGDRQFHRDAITLLSDAGPAICERICLEITETAAVTAIDDAADFTRQVRQLGVRIALDDFGAGASSFGYLKHLSVDVLKIDGQFIQNMIDDPLDDATVRCFVDVARVMGLQTVAEFVDSNAILNRLETLGVNYAQGFLIHKPEPLSCVLGALLPMSRTG